MAVRGRSSLRLALMQTNQCARSHTIAHAAQLTTRHRILWVMYRYRVLLGKRDGLRFYRRENGAIWGCETIVCARNTNHGPNGHDTI